MKPKSVTRLCGLSLSRLGKERATFTGPNLKYLSELLSVPEEELYVTGEFLPRELHDLVYSEPVVKFLLWLNAKPEKERREIFLLLLALQKSNFEEPRQPG